MVCGLRKGVHVYTSAMYVYIYFMFIIICVHHFGNNSKKNSSFKLVCAVVLVLVHFSFMCSGMCQCMYQSVFGVQVIIYRFVSSQPTPFQRRQSFHSFFVEV